MGNLAALVRTLIDLIVHVGGLMADQKVSSFLRGNMLNWKRNCRFISPIIFVLGGMIFAATENNSIEVGLLLFHFVCFFKELTFFFLFSL